MRKRKRRRTPQAGISWERARAIFGDPRPPREVYERQFDGGDEQLRRLARTPHEQIDFSDLWYYHHDLAYVELQPDLFAYLFPACLMDWHGSLMRDEPCSHGDSEFHYGIRRGDVLERMVTEEQRGEICEFFRDGFLERLDAERTIHPPELFDGCAWLRRLNSLGASVSGIGPIWEAWWSFGSPGRARAALKYCSGLMYFDEENPLLSSFMREYYLVDPRVRGFGPPLWKNDSHSLFVGWKQENADFVAGILTVDYVVNRVAAAAECLKGEPDGELAGRLAADLPACQELLELRVAELPLLLADDPISGTWSV